MPRKTAKPYKKDYFGVGDGHSIYYELYGNPKGMPVLFFHGGPGAGFRERHKRLFDPREFNVVFFDQRGSGKSKPFGSLRGNNTMNICGDARKLLAHLEIKKPIVFGESWGATLALCYAIQNPRAVSGIVIRAAFLADKKGISYFTNGPAKKVIPIASERMLGMVPKSARGDPIKYYAREIRLGNKAARGKFSHEFALYETMISHPGISKADAEKKLNGWDYSAWVKIESHYLANGCFLSEGYILRNARKLSGIPTTIMHGRRDLVCSPQNATRLHEIIMGSRLRFTAGGHAAEGTGAERVIAKEIKWAAGQGKAKHLKPAIFLE